MRACTLTAPDHITTSLNLGVILCFLIFASCRLPGQEQSQTVTGHYTTSFETSSFIECASRERWWVEGPALEAVDTFLRDQRGLSSRGEREPLEDGTVFLTWRGDVSGSGEYGHLGAYHRLFRATELLEIRTPGDGDCGPVED